jgi:ribosomal protein S3
MNIEDPKQLAAAIQPVVDSAVQGLVAGLATSVDAAIERSLRRTLDGATITIAIKLQPVADRDATLIAQRLATQIPPTR